MKAAINKKIRENSALSTMGIVIGIIICFIPFTSIYEKIPFGFVTTLLVIFSFVIGFSLIVMGIKAPFEKRTRTYYTIQDGEYDLNSPRCYKPYSVNRFTSILGGYFRWGRFIKEFEFKSKFVKITTNNDKCIKAPLNELIVILKDNKKGMEHAYIMLKHANKKLKICHNSILFDEWEIEDMNRILSYSKEVKVEKWLKIKLPNFSFKDAPTVAMRKDSDGLKDIFSEDREVFREALADTREKELAINEKCDAYDEKIDKIFDKIIIEERTDTEKEVDSEMFKIIEDIKSEEIPILSISEDKLKNIIKNSSAKGFETLFSFYDKSRKDSTDSSKKKTLNNAPILKKLWDYYQDYAYFNRLEGEYVWLVVYFGAILSGISIIFLTLARGLSIWGYILWISGIIVGSFILCIVWFSIYSDKIDKNKKIFLSTRAEVVETGRFPKSDLETISVGIKSLERQFKFFNYFGWFLGLLFIVLMLWRSHL